MRAFFLLGLGISTTLLGAGCYNLDICLSAHCVEGAGGTGSSGSMTTSSTGIPTACALVEGQAIPADCGIFVKASATGSGTQASPVSDVVSAASSVKDKPRIYVCGGESFTGAVTLPSGVSVFGGLDCASWTYHAANPHPKLQGSANLPAVTITEGTQTSFLASIDIEAVDATTEGASSVAVLAANAMVDLEDVFLKAGNGKKGAAGMDGGAQPGVAPGGTLGGNAGTAVPNGGAGAAMNTCDDGASSGGKGGDGGTAPSNGGLNGASGDAGSGANPGFGEVLGGWNCNQGGTNGGAATGTGGNDGTFGTGAPTTDFGTLSATSYINASGKDGQAGTRGQGGGGGGGSKATAALNGAGGGGGGTGGCGGHQGTGGGGGGSSIGVLAFHTTLTLTNVSISLGKGGDGGKGGNGQLGQGGGSKGGGGALGSGVKKACDGGDGGQGGNGGSAGGGRGGHAIGIAYAGAAPTGAPTIAAPGTAGSGGPGGTNTVDQATSGDKGVVAVTQSLGQ